MITKTCQFNLAAINKRIDQAKFDLKIYENENVLYRNEYTYKLKRLEIVSFIAALKLFTIFGSQEEAKVVANILLMSQEEDLLTNDLFIGRFYKLIEDNIITLSNAELSLITYEEYYPEFTGTPMYTLLREFGAKISYIYENEIPKYNKSKLEELYVQEPLKDYSSDVALIESREFDIIDVVIGIAQGIFETIFG